jgi:hypothetical protein
MVGVGMCIILMSG